VTARPAQGGRLLTAWTAWLAAAGLDVPLALPVAVLTGLQGISDRLGALGGSAGVTSAPGRGTRVTGRVPGTEPA
jgi:hypothetical protein